MPSTSVVTGDGRSSLDEEDAQSAVTPTRLGLDSVSAPQQPRALKDVPWGGVEQQRGTGRREPERQQAGRPEGITGNSKATAPMKTVDFLVSIPSSYALMIRPTTMGTQPVTFPITYGNRSGPSHYTQRRDSE